MSSTARLRLLVAALAVAAAGAAGVGCSVTAVSGPSNGSAPSTVVNAYAGDAGADAPTGAAITGGGGADAGATPTYLGSPLCHSPSQTDQITVTCDPDSPVIAVQCNLAPDGGSYDPNAVLACRVQPPSPSGANTTTVSTACSSAGQRADGASCEASQQCGAASDCTGAAASGTCRNYCCAGNAQCAAGTFCDIQPLAQAPNTRIPVCMPIHPAGGCALLDPTACPTGETCAIVREDGSTGCVDQGNAKAHDDCDTMQCAAGLVCLGTPGARSCYTLCHTSSTSSTAECSAPQTCQGGLPLFQDPAVGVCR